MKNNILLLFATLLCLSVFAQDGDTTVIEHQFYTSTFDEVRHIPVLVEYTLTSDMLDCPEHIKRTNKFCKDPDDQLVTDLQKDYSGSGYDRGHNMSAQDNECSEVGMQECFYFSNMFPQPHAINAGIWERLEVHERDLASTDDSVRVFIGNIGRVGTIGPDNVVVPRFCWKVIYIYRTDTYEAYDIPNTTVPEGAVYSDYKVDLKTIESQSGITFDKAVSHMNKL